MSATTINGCEGVIWVPRGSFNPTAGSKRRQRNVASVEWKSAKPNEVLRGTSGVEAESLVRRHLVKRPQHSRSSVMVSSLMPSGIRLIKRPTALSIGAGTTGILLCITGGRTIGGGGGGAGACGMVTGGLSIVTGSGGAVMVADGGCGCDGGSSISCCASAPAALARAIEWANTNPDNLDVPSSSADTWTVVRHGPLAKRTRSTMLAEKWSRRYVVLTQSQLQWYSMTPEGRPSALLGEINLIDSLRVGNYDDDVALMWKLLGVSDPKRGSAGGVQDEYPCHDDLALSEAATAALAKHLHVEYYVYDSLTVMAEQIRQLGDVPMRTL